MCFFLVDMNPLTLFLSMLDRRGSEVSKVDELQCL